MSKNEKELAPPSYEEVMHSTIGQPTSPIGLTGQPPPPPPPTGTATAPPLQSQSPQIGIIYPGHGGYQVPMAPPPQYAPGYVPSYGAIETTPVNVVLQLPPQPADIIVIGRCPACRIGYLEDMYSCLGLLCAIAFFPIGILCCLAMKTKRCNNCFQEF